MRWFAENWFFLVVAVLFVFMHLGHGGHGAHGRHGRHGAPRPRDEDTSGSSPDAPDERAGHRH
jgi:hypothetical protein